MRIRQKYRRGGSYHVLSSRNPVGCVCGRHAEKKTRTIINRRATRRRDISIHVYAYVYYNTKPKRRQWQKSIHCIIYYILYSLGRHNTKRYIAPSITRGVFSSGLVCTLNARTAPTRCFIIYYNIIISWSESCVFELVSGVCGFNDRKSNESFPSADTRTRPCGTATAAPQRYDTILWSFVDFIVIWYTIITIYRMR